MFRISVLPLLFGIFYAIPALSQISPDGTLSTNVTSSDGENFTINDGNQVGNNLFHSFSEFSVPTGGEAFFDNSSNITNILSRVTGGLVTNIDGLIRTANESNLFFINPAGIIFGANARLDLGGSFFGSSADSIIFPDNLEFNANDIQDTPILSINAPIGLGFRDNPEAIINRSAIQDVENNPIGLEVSPGETLALIGGNILNEGGAITALDGNIFLGGLGSAGMVSIDNSFNLSLPANSTLADMVINNAASFNVRAEGRGTINLFGENIAISEAQIRAGVDVGLGSQDIQPGALNIDAINVDIDNSLISIATIGAGNGGNLNINADENLNINSGQIGAGAFQDFPGTAGNSGDINLTANVIDIDNQSVISTITNGEGNAGDFNIEATSLSLDNASIILSSTILGIAKAGNAGNINVDVDTLSLVNGGALSSSTESEGNAGNLNIRVEDSITLIGTSPAEIINGVPAGFSSGFFSSSEAGATGEGGTITVSTNQLSIADGAVLSARTRNTGEGGNVEVSTNTLDITGGGQIVTDANGQGNAGNITLNIAEQINISGSDPTFATRRTEIIELSNQFDPEIIVDPEQTVDPVSPESGVFANTSSRSTGNAGNVSIFGVAVNDGNLSLPSLSLSNSGQVAVNSRGEGNGGNLFIQGSSLALENNAAILASTPQGQGGNIRLGLQDILTLSNDSLISALATGNADGGNIDISADFIVAFPDGNNDIIANAVGGDGGNITISAEAILGIEEGPLSPLTNDINASSNFGLDGNVSINTPDVDAIQGTRNLPSDLIELEQTTAQACQANRVGLAKGGLTVAGKGGIPQPPDLPMNSDNLIEQEALIESTFPPAIETAMGQINPARGMKLNGRCTAKI